MKLSEIQSQMHINASVIAWQEECVEENKQFMKECLESENYAVARIYQKRMQKARNILKSYVACQKMLKQMKRDIDCGTWVTIPLEEYDNLIDRAEQLDYALDMVPCLDEVIAEMN